MRTVTMPAPFKGTVADHQQESSDTPITTKGNSSTSA